MPGPLELIVILLIAILIFGGKKIPQIMEGVGKGIKSFKKAMEGQEETPPASPGPGSPEIRSEPAAKQTEKTPDKLS
jgi:sec-independent protein translocase protein TatA